MKKIILICVMFLGVFCNVCFGAVVTSSYLSPDGVTVEKLDSNRLVLTNAANSVDGGLLQHESVTAGKLDANATPVNRWKESFNNFVYTGLIVPTSDDLDSTTTSGIAYINGIRVVKDATPNTYTASVVTYLDLSENGTYTYSETAGGGAVPSIALNSIRLTVVSTDSTKVTFVSDERTTTVVLGTGSAISLVDTDQDTKVQVEKNSDEDIIRFDTEGTEQIIIQDGEILPTTDDDINLGSSSKQFKNLYIDGTASIDVLSADLTTISGLLTLKSGQINFPSTAVPSGNANTQDEYEEGLYAPTIVCSTSGSYTTATFTKFAYTKVGRVVHIQGYLNISSENSPDGELRFSLPFTATDLTELADRIGGSAVLRDHGGTLPNGVSVNVDGGDLFFTLENITDAGVRTTIDRDDVDSAWGLAVNFSYISE